VGAILSFTALMNRPNLATVGWNLTHFDNFSITYSRGSIVNGLELTVLLCAPTCGFICLECCGLHLFCTFLRGGFGLVGLH